MIEKKFNMIISMFREILFKNKDIISGRELVGEGIVSEETESFSSECIDSIGLTSLIILSSNGKTGKLFNKKINNIILNNLFFIKFTFN